MVAELITTKPRIRGTESISYKSRLLKAKKFGREVRDGLAIKVLHPDLANGLLANALELEAIAREIANTLQRQPGVSPLSEARWS